MRAPAMYSGTEGMGGKGTGSGMMPLEDATWNSVNAVYARLAWALGIKNVTHTARTSPLRLYVTLRPPAPSTDSTHAAPCSAAPHCPAPPRHRRDSPLERRKENTHAAAVAAQGSSAPIQPKTGANSRPYK